MSIYLYKLNPPVVEETSSSFLKGKLIKCSSFRCNNDPAGIHVVAVKSCGRVRQLCRVVPAFDPGSVSRKYLSSSTTTKGVNSPVWAHGARPLSPLTVDCKRCQHTSRPGSVSTCKCLPYTLYDLLLQQNVVVWIKHTSVDIGVVLIIIIQE